MTQRLFQFSGAVPPDGLYIARRADQVYVRSLMSTTPVHLHGSRQCGKTSLLLRAAAECRKQYAVSYVDLQGVFPSAELSDFVDHGPRIASAVARQLGSSGLWHEVATRNGLARSLADMVVQGAKPTILLFDELDCLPSELRHELRRTLRALLQMQAYTEGLKVNVSLCGVQPPRGEFNDGHPRDAVDTVHGSQIWLDDFGIDLEVAEQISRAFSERLQPPIDMPLPAALSLLAYSGGYPQACGWLSNMVVERVGELRFDESFPQQLRDLARQHFDPAARLPSHVREEMRANSAWVKTTEKFLLGRRAQAREALDVYESVIAASGKQSAEQQVVYEHGNQSHELLRLCGLARLDVYDRLRTRCPLFEDVFGAAWTLDMRRRLSESRYGDDIGSGQRSPSSRRISPRLERRLLVIGAGGTIGMTYDDRGDVVPITPRGVNWMHALGEMLSTEPLFERAFEFDSADVGPAQWSKIVRTIVQHQDEVDGVLVAHGTDTMAYTASAVAFALGRDLSFPVVFTGSQTTVDVVHGDAVANILRGALVAAQDLPEVVVSFGEKIFRATRTQKKDDLRFDAFESPGYPELGFVAEDVQIFQQNVLARRTKDAAPLTNVQTGFSSGILHVAQMPGSEAAFYEAALGVRSDGAPLCKAVIIQSLGAGNVPWRSRAFDLTTMIENAEARGIPVVLTSQYPVLPANYLRYKPSARAIEAGAIPTGNMTIAAVVAKLSWVIPQVDKEIEDGMLKVDRRIERVAEMMVREYVGEGGLSVVDDAEVDLTSTDVPS